MSKKGFKIQDLEEMEQFESIVKDGKKIVVVDAYKKWCGPTSVMRPTFERVFAATDNATSRLVFISIDRALIAAHPGFEKSPLSEATLKSSRPLFVLFKHKLVVGKVGGCNAPDIMSLVADLIAADI
jgi:thiol-disulfide isomerase/thioredoxin|tara:strand:+ start:58 stop:438 length:381 start_codon:yes stop_codon:yes gene_type:complete